MLLRILALTAFTVAAVFVAGCGDKDKDKAKNAPPTEFKNKDEHGHDHTSGKEMKEDAKIDGKACHACLTAHLSKKEGNELDVFFETEAKEPKPVFLPENAKLTATITRKGDEEKRTLQFEPAEKEERKDDPAGKCSRFTAKAPWMKHEDMLTVTLTIEGQDMKPVWIDFNPKKFAHVDE